MLDLQEVDCRQGINLTDTPEPLPKDPAFAEMENVAMPKPDRPGILRQAYSKGRPFTPSPRVPEPYKTFAETFSYGL